jgi:hypothetical protein
VKVATFEKTRILNGILSCGLSAPPAYDKPADRKFIPAEVMQALFEKSYASSPNRL